MRLEQGKIAAYNRRGLGIDVWTVFVVESNMVAEHPGQSDVISKFPRHEHECQHRADFGNILRPISDKDTLLDSLLED